MLCLFLRPQCFDRGKSVYGLSLALGGGEASLLQMTNAFGVFASGGYYQDPVAIIKIEDKNGNDLNYKVGGSKNRVLNDQIAFIISDILSDNNARLLAFGPGNELEFLGNKVAAKTGTTDDIRDNWTIGYTTDIVVGVWAGNNDNTPMNSRLASGVTGAAPIWNRSITLFLDPDIPNKFEQPKDIVKTEVGKITGGSPADGLEEKRWEFFVKNTEPKTRSDMVVELEVCEEDGKIANDECKDDDKAEKREYIKLKALLPEWQESVDAWVDKYYDKDKDEFKKFHPPTKKSDYED
jgi:membrane carboxypeptidase/penicillin-binding protein